MIRRTLAHRLSLRWVTVEYRRVTAAIRSLLAPSVVHQPRGFCSLYHLLYFCVVRNYDIAHLGHINKFVPFPAIRLGQVLPLRGSLWLPSSATMCPGLPFLWLLGEMLLTLLFTTPGPIPVLGCWPWFERVPSECIIVVEFFEDFSTALVNEWVSDSKNIPFNKKKNALDKKNTIWLQKTHLSLKQTKPLWKKKKNFFFLFLFEKKKKLWKTKHWIFFSKKIFEQNKN